MHTTDDALFNAYQILASAVRDLRSAGRRSLGATVKPQLYRRGITEFQLGFPKFGDFLRAAEAAGFVRLNWSEGGDIEVWLPEVAQQPTVQTTTAAFSPATARAPYAFNPSWAGPSARYPPNRVRQDLWNAFNSFSDKWVYDVAHDKAYKVPTGQADLFPPGSRLVAIPAARERMTDWMKSFADTQEGETKVRLLAASEGEASLYRFKNTMAGNPRLHRSWRNYHIQQVVAAIDAWATANNVRPKDVSPTASHAAPVYWPPPLLEPPAATRAPQSLAAVG